MTFTVIESFVIIIIVTIILYYIILYYIILYYIILYYIILYYIILYYIILYIVLHCIIIITIIIINNNNIIIILGVVVVRSFVMNIWIYVISRVRPSVCLPLFRACKKIFTLDITRKTFSRILSCQSCLYVLFTSTIVYHFE